MITNLTAQNLIDFETDIGECFNKGLIKAPIHLYDGNENAIIKIFSRIKPQDWIFCTWRSHYQCLLKGVPPDLLKQKILEGKSISLCFPEYKIFSSAIVTGSIPIAVGVAMAAARNGLDETVYCFIGDMAAETGVFHECWKYSVAQKLPIKFVIEDNDKSVCTITSDIWGNMKKLSYKDEFGVQDKIIYYEYKSKYPHAGAGQRIQF